MLDGMCLSVRKPSAEGHCTGRATQVQRLFTAPERPIVVREVTRAAARVCRRQMESGCRSGFQPDSNPESGLSPTYSAGPATYIYDASLCSSSHFAHSFAPLASALLNLNVPSKRWRHVRQP